MRPAVAPIEDTFVASRFGALRIEGDGRIRTFSEKPQFEDAHVNGGYMVFEHRMFD